MSFQLRQATMSDIPRLRDIYFSAFADTLIMQRCLPPASAAARAFILQALECDIERAECHFLVVEDVLSQPRRPVAFAQWIEPVDQNGHAEHAEATFPDDGDPDFAKEFFGTLAQKRKEIMGDRKHWFLELIATDKGYQGRGAASPLLRWGIDRADREAKPCYLDSTPGARPVYEKFGFAAVQTKGFADGQFEQSFMVRKART